MDDTMTVIPPTADDAQPPAQDEYPRPGIAPPWEPPRPSWVVRLNPSALLTITLVEYILLVLLLVGYQFNWLGLHRLPAVIGGVLPLIVPWAGALGAVCISLVAVTAHWDKWDSTSHGAHPTQAEKWNGWYLVRVPLGAGLGTIAAMMVILFLGTVTKTSNGTIDLTPTGAATLMVIAFLVGYKQETFRTLLERTLNVIQGPRPPEPARARHDDLHDTTKPRPDSPNTSGDTRGKQSATNQDLHQFDGPGSVAAPARIGAPVVLGSNAGSHPQRVQPAARGS
jgi:hypothetical protein